MFRDSVPFTVAGVFFLMLVVIWSLDVLSDTGPRGKVKYPSAGYTVTIVSPPTR
jgi:hypothetical protein